MDFQIIRNADYIGASRLVSYYGYFSRSLLSAHSLLYYSNRQNPDGARGVDIPIHAYKIRANEFFVRVIWPVAIFSSGVLPEQ